MTKQDQFLYFVQTTILTNSVNLASDPKTRDLYRSDLSAAGVLGTLQDAMEASEKIPPTMAAITAAGEFCEYMLRNLRDLNENVVGDRMQVPHWFARG